MRQVRIVIADGVDNLHLAVTEPGTKWFKGGVQPKLLTDLQGLGLTNSQGRSIPVVPIIIDGNHRIEPIVPSLHLDEDQHSLSGRSCEGVQRWCAKYGPGGHGSRHKRAHARKTQRGHELASRPLLVVRSMRTTIYRSGANSEVVMLFTHAYISWNSGRRKRFATKKRISPNACG